MFSIHGKIKIVLFVCVVRFWVPSMENLQKIFTSGSKQF